MKRHSTKALSEALNIEWDGGYFDDEKGQLFDNYAPYGGGGAGKKNGHYGCKHSEEAKRKMREKKKNYVPWNKNVKGYSIHTEQSRKAISEKLSGAGNGRSILCENDVLCIINLYNSKPHLDGVGEVCRNGVKMNYMWAFCKYISTKYSITPAAVKRLLLRKTWKNVWEKYEVSNKD